MKLILLIMTLPMFMLSCEKSDISERKAPITWQPMNPFKGTWKLVATYNQQDTVQVTDGRGIKITENHFWDCGFIDESGAYITYKYDLKNASTGQELNIRNGLYRFKPSKVDGKLILEWSKTNFINIFVPYNQTKLDSVISIGCF